MNNKTLVTILLFGGYRDEEGISHADGRGSVSIPFINLDFTTLDSPFATGFVPGASLTATTKANTTFYPTVANTVDIFFKNGSPNFDHTVQWMLFRVRV